MKGKFEYFPFIEPEDWRVGLYRTAILVVLEPEVFEEEMGIILTDTDNDPDYARAVELILRDGTEICVSQHKRAPLSGADVGIPENSQDITRDINCALSEFGYF